jgi:hypothetical protein
MSGSAASNGEARAKVERARDRCREAEVRGLRDRLEGLGALMPGVVSDVVRETFQGVSVSDRLKRKFGLGQKPDRRQALYFRLEALAHTHGDKVLVLISTAVAQAAGANDPGRYFSAAVVRMLREAGLAGGEASW